MTLIDTSVWIELFGDRPSPGVAALEELIRRREDLAVCGVVMTELLQGIRDDGEHARVHGVLADLLFLPMEQSTFVLAADVYRSLRKKGVTVRSSIDCMIAAVCLENNARLLHHDKDFDAIAKHFPLKIVSI